MEPLKMIEMAPAFHTQKAAAFITNRAFNSLSFRGMRNATFGKRGYSTNMLSRSPPIQESPSLTKRPRPHSATSQTYGAILITKQANGSPLYALVRGSYTGKWSFPKGHSDDGEEPLQCALREVAEETGLETLPQPAEYIQLEYGKYYIFHFSSTPLLIPRDTHEIMDAKWVTLEEMKKMPLNADVSQYLKKQNN